MKTRLLYLNTHRLTAFAWQQGRLHPEGIFENNDDGLKQTVKAHVDGVPVMECGYGTMNGRYALKVNSMISQSEME